MSLSQESKWGLGRRLAVASLIRILNAPLFESRQLSQTRLWAPWGEVLITLHFPQLPDLFMCPDLAQDDCDRELGNKDKTDSNNHNPKQMAAKRDTHQKHLEIDWFMCFLKEFFLL